MASSSAADATGLEDAGAREAFDARVGQRERCAAGARPVARGPAGECDRAARLHGLHRGARQAHLAQELAVDGSGEVLVGHLREWLEHPFARAAHHRVDLVDRAEQLGDAGGILEVDPARPLAFSSVTNTAQPLSKGAVRKSHEELVGVTSF